MIGHYQALMNGAPYSDVAGQCRLAVPDIVAAAERLKRQLHLMTGLEQLGRVGNLRIVAKQIAVEHDTDIRRVQGHPVVPQAVLQRR